MIAFLIGIAIVVLAACIVLPIIGAVIGLVFRLILRLFGFDNN